MKSIVGQTVGLRASEKHRLEKLLHKRVPATELLQPEFARRLAHHVTELERQLALLISREGEILHLIIGTKDRVYLPDLGRIRLDPGRLRRVRLVVLAPETSLDYQKRPYASTHFGQFFQEIREKAEKERKSVDAPIFPNDLITDLEKLRLDSVALAGVTANGEIAGVSLAFIEPNARQKAGDRGVGYLYRDDFTAFDFDFSEFIRQAEESLTEHRPRSFETAKNCAVLVGAYTSSARDAEASMLELEELARTAGLTVLDKIIQRRKMLDPRTVIGKGKVEELVLHCLDLGAEMVIFDRELSPGQLRSITNLTDLKVLDRSMLILDIFAQRAKSSEGRLQVELAQLKYSLPRLTETDTGLSRLTGGIGGRGPGETKLEIGRRRARDRIVDVERRIKKLAAQRGLRRERRQSRGVPVVAIVGYTNAGKSTLLNALTKGDVFVENKLFATLDTSSRRMRFPNEREVVFVDTVGFIRELPKELVNAFRATLEEVGEADLLLHLVDASNPEARRQIEVVEETLKSLEFDEKPRLLVFNKSDELSEIEQKGILNTHGGIMISAAKRVNLENLIAQVQGALQETFEGQDPGRFTEISPWNRYQSVTQSEEERETNDDWE